MKKSTIVRVFLGISGIIGICIGAGLLFAPVAFEASAGIALGEDINLRSEVRAPGGALLAAGIWITLGAFIPGMTQTAIVLSCLFYLSYGLSRTFGMMVDGIPGESLVAATVVELVIGVFSLYLLIKLREKQRKPAGDHPVL